MKTVLISLFVVFFFINDSLVTSWKVTIKDNGYEDIRIGLPSTLSPKRRPSLISNLKKFFQQSSDLLQYATKGRAKFSSFVFLIPNEWGDINSWLPNGDSSVTFNDSTPALHFEKPDIVITNNAGQKYPYTVHQQGCGQQSLRIYIPSHFSMTGSLQQRSVEFVRLWSEFRYGIFPEGGFENDEKFPLTYNVPGDTTSRETNCINRPFRIPVECEASWKCEGNQVIPSIMDQHYTNGTAFCEGHAGLGQIHVPDAPSKHNLLCNEEGTYYTVLRSPDFRNGRNSAPRNQSSPEVSFRYVKEPTSMRVMVAFQISAEMGNQNRYSAAKNAFFRFVYHDLPDGSIFSVFTFGGGNNLTRLTPSEILIEDISSRVSYLETQTLPDELSEVPGGCSDCALSDIIEIIKNNDHPPPHIVLLTTELSIKASSYRLLVNDLNQLEVRLHVFMFPYEEIEPISDGFNWYSLCKETGGSFVSLGDDLLGNLYKSFSSIAQPITKSVQVAQAYLRTLDEEDLRFSFPIDDAISKFLLVSLTGPPLISEALGKGRTFLFGPDNKKFYLQIQGFIPAWIFNVSNPKTGEYTLKTWRRKGETSPVLITVTGQPSKVNETITARVWTETLKMESNDTQSPILIFGEIRRGTYPIMNATVKAYVYHPNYDGVSEIDLLDDGLGSVDISKYDGIYSRYFTNFTSVGYYSVLLKITGGFDTTTAVRKGPSSHCCGSSFPSTEQIVLSPFVREAGPVTFEITSVPKIDPYPPAKVTDLRIQKFASTLFVANWTAVGDDYDQGIASFYELKVFRDRSMVTKQFFDSGLEVENKTITTDDGSIYGRTLFEELKFTKPLESGLYYVGIRAVDDAGNCGEPSNVATILIDSIESNRFTDCGNDPVALKRNGVSTNHISSIFFYFHIIYVFGKFILQIIGFNRMYF